MMAFLISAMQTAGNAVNPLSSGLNVWLAANTLALLAIAYKVGYAAKSLDQLVESVKLLAQIPVQLAHLEGRIGAIESEIERHANEQ